MPVSFLSSAAARSPRPACLLPPLTSNLPHPAPTHYPQDREGPEGPVRGSRPREEVAAAPRRAPLAAGAGGPRGPRPGAAPRAGGGGGGVPGTSVYVGNLPWSFDWKALKDLFAEYGPGYADVKIGNDGRSRGYGIVRFDTPDAAAAAIAALNGTPVGDPPREIVVREDRPPE